MDQVTAAWAARPGWGKPDSSSEPKRQPHLTWSGRTGRGSAGRDPSHWQGEIPPPFLWAPGPRERGAPFSRHSQSCAARNSAPAGVGRRHSRQQECSGILHDALPRGEPQEAERLATACLPAWPSWASQDAPDACPPLCLPGVVKGRDSVLL